MRYLCLLCLLCVLLVPGLLLAEDSIPVRDNVAVFTAGPKGIEVGAVLSESSRVLGATFGRLGRFLSAEPARRDSALESAVKENSADPWRRAAEIMGVDIYIVLDAYRTGDLIVAEMKVHALNHEYRRLEGDILVKSRIAINIPYKLGIEAAHLHRGLEVRASVRAKKSDGTVVIDAGQWHGLKKGTYSTRGGGSIEILSTGRFTSHARLPGRGEGEVFISSFPDYKQAAAEAMKRIEYNTEFKYGLENTLLQGTDPEKRFIEGACVINTGANLCLPGYGSFLATRYLGFEKNSAEMASVTLSAGLIATHLTLTEFMTGFKINFFPGVHDGEKDTNVRNLQYFLWGSLPLTYTVSYLDQLAYQFGREEHLPPFFRDRNEAAVTMSIFLPGGGLFYKGHRLAGWGYYFSEMFLAGYGAYNLGNGRKAVYAFSLLGAIKAVELLNAYLAGPSYEFFRNETERGRNRAGLSFGMIPGVKNDTIYTFSLNQSF